MVNNSFLQGVQLYILFIIYITKNMYYKGLTTDFYYLDNKYLG